MPDGRIDGHFIVNTNLATSIRNELGLSETECKQMGSVWNQVLDEANNSSNYEKANQEVNNSNIQIGTVVKFTKECWNKIVDMVNNALKSFSDKQIQAEDADEYSDNVNLGNLAIQQFNEKHPNVESKSYYGDLIDYLSRYGNDKEKLEELKSNPQFTDLVKYIEGYQSGKINIGKLNKKVKQLEDGNGVDMRCELRANELRKNFAEQGIKSEVISLANLDFARPEHSFCVIGMAENADTTEPSTWGKDAVIVDAWLGKTFSVEEGISYYEEFFRYNDNKDENGNIKEYKMTIGTTKQIQDKFWELNK